MFYIGIQVFILKIVYYINIVYLLYNSLSIISIFYVNNLFRFRFLLRYADFLSFKCLFFDITEMSPFKNINVETSHGRKPILKLLLRQRLRRLNLLRQNNQKNYNIRMIQ